LCEPARRVAGALGWVAVQRGPLVLALESVDLPDGLDVNQVEVVREDPQDLDGVTHVRLRAREAADCPWPYTSDAAHGSRDLGQVALVPYNKWATRGRSTMRVWIPVADGHPMLVLPEGEAVR